MREIPIVVVIDFSLYLQCFLLQIKPGNKPLLYLFIYTCSISEFIASIKAVYGKLRLLTVNFPEIK